MFLCFVRLWKFVFQAENLFDKTSNEMINVWFYFGSFLSFGPVYQGKTERLNTDTFYVTDF